MPIQRLSSLLVNQIAAGEVIERPASVVKELVENSIDALSTRIDVTIEVGGKELIRISDDGGGIAIDQLPLAIAPHATSKISEADDLNAIATLGFRGEALASIASVSRLSILSRPREQVEAGLIEIEGDVGGEPRPAGGAPGTVVTVRNLFFNTPARRKFLRTDQTETGRISDMMQNLALAHPEIGFTLHIDRRQKLDLPPRQTPTDRALSTLGNELREELLELKANERGIGMWGLVGRPSIARGTSKHQRVFLNGRLINDKSISHAIKEAYRGLLDHSRWPTIVLFLQIDPSMVDVNVHPAKAEVRFRNQSSIHGAVLNAVRATLHKADLTPRFDLNRTQSLAGALAIPGAPLPEFGSGLEAKPLGSSSSTPASSTFVDYFKRLDPQQKGFIYSEVREALAIEAPEMITDPQPQDQHEEKLPGVKAVENVLQIHSSYIVTQDAEGIVIIDQHALHERVMFEKLKARIESSSGGGNLESQRLLMPATIQVDRNQAEAIGELQDLLTRIGIEAELMGPTTVAVHAFSSLLFERNVDPVDFMHDFLEKAINMGLNHDPEAALHEVLDMMACKAAIKAGDRLTEPEIEELLAYRQTVERSSNCPHGRPTTLRLSLADLEKQFGRR
ncbi:MAG: DNA mismatch repair endonuclease MutL [Planctomycetota bacterium]|nr:DNA mismatch repair endonuclease MutL [Planctomycetota bacterium]